MVSSVSLMLPRAATICASSNMSSNAVIPAQIKIGVGMLLITCLNFVKEISQLTDCHEDTKFWNC